MKPRVVACAIAFATLLAGLASAQAPASQPSPSSPVVQPTATPSDTSSQATLYFYRYKQFVGSALSPSVYCDDAELARMDNGKYFTVTLAPGHHTFRSNDKQSGIELDLSRAKSTTSVSKLLRDWQKGMAGWHPSQRTKVLMKSRN